MDTDKIVDLGNVAEAILTNPLFNELCALFEEETVHKMVQTKPTESEAREAIYATLVGAREFNGFLQSYVQERNKLLKPDAAPAPEDDAAVLDIYRE
jgi:hypothetical protein